MFDEIIYKILDKIVSWCERYKEYKIRKTLPKATYDIKEKQESLKKWVSEQDKSYK